VSHCAAAAADLIDVAGPLRVIASGCVCRTACNVCSVSQDELLIAPYTSSLTSNGVSKVRAYACLHF
jgi:hypothetical protein